MRVRLSATLASTDIVRVLDIMPVAWRGRNIYLSLHGNRHINRDIFPLRPLLEDHFVNLNWHLNFYSLVVRNRHHARYLDLDLNRNLNLFRHLPRSRPHFLHLCESDVWHVVRLHSRN